MITAVDKFEESTAFERWTLEALVPLPPRRPHRRSKVVATNHLRVTPVPAVARAYADGVQEVHVDLRPLAFGAAWKVLDLLLELAFANAGTTSSTGQLTIATKRNLAGRGHGNLPPLTADRALWRTLTGVYAGTTEVRNSLVHRLAKVDRATGALTGHDRQGQALVPISGDQQEAFCRAIQRAAMAALTGRISPREHSDLAWQLDQLRAHHQQPVLGGVQFQPPVLLIVSPNPSGGQLVIDIPALLRAAQSSWPDRHIDARFSLPDGSHFIAEVESAPASVNTVDLNDPPNWLQDETAGMLNDPLTGQHLQFMRTGKQTGGQLLEVEVLLDPGARVPRHLHLRQDERVEVLEGSVSIQLGQQQLQLTEGESIQVPRRTLHRVRNSYDGRTRFLLQVRPARRMEAAMRAIFAVAGVLGRLRRRSAR
jgi:quercetin dioxygenase-like cupin family protein